MGNGTNHTRHVYGLAIAILFVSSSAVSSDTWTEINSGLPSLVTGAGGLAIDPTNPSTLYSWTSNRGLFKSTDGAANWQTVGGIAGVDWLVVDPKDSARLYAGTSYGLVKSVNGGASWIGFNTGPRWLSSVVIDPQDSDTLYAVSSSIIKSTDGGASWKTSNAGLTGLPYPRFVAIDPVTPSTLYATVENGGIFKSTDRGASWFAIKEGLANIGGGTLALAIDPVTPSIMYAGSFAAATGPSAGRSRFDAGQGSISKSTDGGQSWKVVRAGIPTDSRVNSFVIDPASPSNVYANIVGGGSGVIKSTDHGETWNVLDTGIPAGNFVVSPVVMDPEHPSTIYFGYVAGDGVGGVSKSTDGGASWYPANAGRNFADVRALAIHPVDTNVLYTAAGADGVFKSVDSGENWTRLAAFQFPVVPFNPQAAASVFQAGTASIRSLVIDFVRPNILYALTGRVAGCHSMDRVLLKSTDGGTNWSDASPPLSGCSFWNFGNAVPMVVDPTDPDTLYVGADFGDINGENPALLKTTDGGTSWSAPQGWGCCAANALAVDPTDSATLYGGTWSGVMKSIDGGTTWSNTGLSIGVNVLALDPVNPSIVYAAADTGYGSFGGLFKSTDGGASWFAINNGLASLIDTRAPITALVVDPARPQTIYAGTGGYGVFKSTDGGGDWNQFNDGLMSPDIRALTLAPATSSTLYAVTTKGVFAVREPN